MAAPFERRDLELRSKTVLYPLSSGWWDLITCKVVWGGGNERNAMR